MAILYSRVTLSNEYYGISEFFVSGFPQEMDDLEGWYGFDDYVEEIDDSAVIDVHVEAFLYGEGETVWATPEEVVYMLMRMERDPDFLVDRCDNVGDTDFTIDWFGSPLFEAEWN